MSLTGVELEGSLPVYDLSTEEVKQGSIWGWLLPIFDNIGTFFGLLTTQYSDGIESKLEISKSGGHLINVGTIEGALSLNLDYKTIYNSGELSSSRGSVNIHADQLTIRSGGLIRGNVISLDVKRLEICGGEIDAKEAIRITSCAEVILSGIEPTSSTWEILKYLPKGCIKTVTTSSAN